MTPVNDQSTEPGSKPFWRRWWFWLAVAVLGAAVSPIIIYIRGQNEVASLRGAIRARGEPITSDELADYYLAPPADRDATQLWLRAGAALETASNAKSDGVPPFFRQHDEIPLPGEPWPDLEISRTFLASQAVAMRQLHEAAAMGGEARYPIQFQGITTLLDHIKFLRVALRSILLEAHVRAHDGDLHGVSESIHTGLVLSQSLRNEPIEVTQMFRANIHRTMVQQLRRMDRANVAAPDLELLQSTLAQIEFADGMKRAAVGERAFGLMMFDDPAAAGFLQMAYYVWLARGGDQAAYLRIMADYVAATEQPWTEAIDAMEAWSAKRASRIGRFQYLTGLLTPGVANLTIACARAETLNRLAIIDLSIARYRQQNGRPPVQLADLAPEYLAEIPLDPTTGNPFSYQATADRYLLYTPSKRFPLASQERLDAETGAHPELVFRWPPSPVESPAAEKKE